MSQKWQIITYTKMWVLIHYMFESSGFFEPVIHFDQLSTIWFLRDWERNSWETWFNSFSFRLPILTPYCRCRFDFIDNNFLRNRKLMLAAYAYYKMKTKFWFTFEMVNNKKFLNTYHTDKSNPLIQYLLNPFSILTFDRSVMSLKFYF